MLKDKFLVATLSPFLLLSSMSLGLAAGLFDGSWAGSQSGGRCNRTFDATIADGKLIGTSSGLGGTVAITGTVASDGSFSGKTAAGTEITGKFSGNSFQ